jgi:hypothetical protein
MSLPSDHESAQGVLAHVRQLAGRLDLDHPDPDYQASVADRLADAAHQLAHDLRLVARGRRIRHHLRVVHDLDQQLPPAAEWSVVEWLTWHDLHHARNPALDHDHPDELALGQFTGVDNADDLSPYHDLP